jgi:hypothetical protein
MYTPAVVILYNVNLTYIIYGFCMILRTNSNYFPEHINILVFVTEINHIISEEEREFFNITRILTTFMLRVIYLHMLSLSRDRNKFLALSKTTVSLSADGR